MAIKLKLELKWTKIKRVVTLPRGLNLEDLSGIIQAMLGFEHDHLWNFRNKAGKEWDTGCDPFGGPLNMDMRGILDPGEFCIEDVLADGKENFSTPMITAMVGRLLSRAWRTAKTMRSPAWRQWGRTRWRISAVSADWRSLPSY